MAALTTQGTRWLACFVVDCPTVVILVSCGNDLATFVVKRQWQDNTDKTTIWRRNSKEKAASRSFHQQNKEMSSVASTSFTETGVSLAPVHWVGIRDKINGNNQTVNKQKAGKREDPIPLHIYFLGEEQVCDWRIVNQIKRNCANEACTTTNTDNLSLFPAFHWLHN